SRASRAALAVNDDVGRRGKPVDVLGKGPQRDLEGAGQRREGDLVRLAHVHEDEVVASVHLRLQLLDGDGRNFLRYAAEVVVVDEAGDGRALPADGAARVLPELQLAEGHGERV